jgi:phosphomannomutase
MFIGAFPPDLLSSLKLIICDLDGTLADSKVPASAEVVRDLEHLLDLRHVCIISGGRQELIENQVLSSLRLTDARRSRLHLMPACGTRYIRWGQGAWLTIHDERLTQNETSRAEAVLVQVAKELGLWETTPHGEVMDNRGGQFTYSVLGQQAPPDLKRAWDPTGEKKARIIELAQPLMEGLSVASGKSTSIDVTRVGVDKSFGVRKLLGALQLNPGEALFIGDSLEPGGNDYSVRSTGVYCVEVANWRETHTLFEFLLVSLD